MTPEERKKLRDKVTSSPEAWDSWIRQLEAEIAEEKYPGWQQEVSSLLAQQEAIENKLEEIYSILRDPDLGGAISGAPYVRSYMILYGIEDPKIANRVMLNYMYPDQYPSVPGYERENLI